LNIGVSDFSPYISEGIAENLSSALKQLDQADGALVKSCIEICEMAHKSGSLDELEADDASMALAIIRKASMDIDQLISYPELKRVLREQDEKVYRVTSNLDEIL
jgi:HSP90 family molecular chaperone